MTNSIDQLVGTPGHDLSANAESARTTLQGMWAVRLFEEAVDSLFARGLMHGTMHLSIGQEASAIGACAALRQTDFITSTHRGHGHCIAAADQRIDDASPQVRLSCTRRSLHNKHIASLNLQRRLEPAIGPHHGGINDP